MFWQLVSETLVTVTETVELFWTQTSCPSRAPVAPSSSIVTVSLVGATYALAD